MKLAPPALFALAFALTAPVAAALTASPPPIPLPAVPKNMPPPAAPGLPTLPTIPKAAPASAVEAPPATTPVTPVEAPKAVPAPKHEATEEESFISRVPLPQEKPGMGSGPAGAPIKNIKALQPRPGDDGGDAAGSPNAARTVLGVVISGYMLGMLGLLLSGVIVFALARGLLRRAVSHVHSNHEVHLTDSELGDGASAAEASPTRRRFSPPMQLTTEERDLQQRLTVAVPELVVHAKVAASELIATDTADLGRQAVDFAVARQDGVVTALVLLDGEATKGTRDDLATLLQDAGYRVLRYLNDTLPDAATLREQLLAPT